MSAATLSRRYNVAVRTIQRDMEAIELAGIPIISVQGPNGGYGIMDTFKMDRQLVSVDDLFYIITALRSVASTLEDEAMGDTLHKVETLLPSRETDFFSDRRDKLNIDFSMLGGDPRQRGAFKTVRSAVESNRLLRFLYTNARL